jgi:hypothetical protein
MLVPYSAFSQGKMLPVENRVRESVAAVTQTFQRSSFVHTTLKFMCRFVDAAGCFLHGPGSASDAYDARHARDVAALNRMARSLETSQPALAAELMLLACR